MRTCPTCRTCGPNSLLASQPRVLSASASDGLISSCSNEIGRGSHGTVYRAWDTRLAREVALKLLPDTDDGRSNIEEARRLARVSHRHVVSVYGADRIDGHVGIWMELLKGRTLDAILREQGPFSAREAIVIAVDICGAVAAIHSAGLIHRDLKAQNVMREPGGRLVVMDVGASITLTTMTPDRRRLPGRLCTWLRSCSTAPGRA